MLYRMTTGAPIFGLRREIDRLFEDTFGRDGGTFTPAVDIKESEKEIRLDLELPGIKPDQVEIIAENGILTVRGEKRTERKEGEDDRYQVVERTYGTFARTFQLPQGIDENQIDADFHDGVLCLHIPKTALPQPKRIQIKGGDRNQQTAGKSNDKQVSGSPQRQRDNEVAAQAR